MSNEEQVEKLREQTRITTVMLQEIVDDPSILDGFSKAEMAWLQEHLEHITQEAAILKAQIDGLLGEEAQ